MFDNQDQMPWVGHFVCTKINPLTTSFMVSLLIENVLNIRPEKDIKTVLKFLKIGIKECEGKTLN